MDHYRQRKYRGPETWARVRDAYVAGESGPSVARRFDVGLANLRKRAMREGWTRNRTAVALDAQLPPRREEGSPGEPALADAEAPYATAPMPVLEAIAVASTHAAGLLAEGRAAEANAMIVAISNLAKLVGMTADPGRQAILRRLLLEME